MAKKIAYVIEAEGLAHRLAMAVNPEEIAPEEAKDIALSVVEEFYHRLSQDTMAMKDVDVEESLAEIASELVFDNLDAAALEAGNTEPFSCVPAIIDTAKTLVELTARIQDHIVDISFVGEEVCVSTVRETS